ncbi:hypothetical protein IW261DRAFT_1449883 [Armillaria novae-zelandiae]|uniref:Uncharacterized protein n=1 Tax=Armillaria novae-zelandiae TaxID=153914 RepID=A0AA39PQ82_9AGAR|nr:hypothetical protein IW261DRAFT_1449883 [Armillaria novae-zelandiae]
MYLVARTATRQNSDPSEAWEQILIWIKIVMGVISDIFVNIFKDYAYAFRWFSTCLISTNDLVVNQVLYPLGTILQANPRLALFISIIMVIGPWIILIPLILILAPLILIQEAYILVLTVLGFNVSGITCGSPATLFHSFCYDEDTTPGSLFAYLQTAGAIYQVNTARNPFLLVMRVVAWVVAVYMIVTMAP